MDEKLIATLNKKEVYVPLLIGTILFLAVAGAGTFYFFMRPENTKSSAVVERTTVNSVSKLTDEEKDLNALDKKTDNLDSELNNANDGLNDTQTDLTY